MLLQLRNQLPKGPCMMQPNTQKLHRSPLNAGMEASMTFQTLFLCASGDTSPKAIQQQDVYAQHLESDLHPTAIKPSPAHLW
jgi:hypothetical protein